MQAGLISYLPVIFSLYVIAGLVFFKNSQSKINKLFALFTFCLASWLAALFASDLVQDAEVSLWIMRVASLFGTLSLPFFFYFCLAFPVEIRKISRKIGLAISVPSAIFAVLSFSPWLIPAVEFIDGSTQLADVSTLYSIQSIFLIGGYALGMLILFYKYGRIDNARQKNQIALVIWGIGIAIAVNSLTNFILIVFSLGNSLSNALGSISFLIFVAATAYAISKHGMFDIRAAIVRAIGFGVTIIIVASVFSLIVLGIASAFLSEDYKTIDLDSPELLLLLPPMIFTALTFHRLEQYIRKITTRIFYQDAYDLRDTLDALSDALLTDNDIDKLMNQSLKIICTAIRPQFAYFAVLNPTGEIYKDRLIDKNKAPQIEKYLDFIKSQDMYLINRDELPSHTIGSIMEKDDATLLMRLGSIQQPIGILIFGPKRNGRIYSNNDIGLLQISAKNLGVAIDNAKRYEQISHFADTLNEEVQRATARLRKANEKLKTMDAMKDDFLSMASHQLRSPATSVHEALRMLNHPVFSEDDREHLVASAEASSERLVTVVKTMLNMARLQAGRFTIDRSETDLCEIAEKVLLQTKILANEKGIKILFDKPYEPIVMQADRAKISEAMANYVENAIKYSPPKSKIEIKLEKQPRKAVFEVIDNGMGVPDSERKNLFDKFYRATNARNEEPDGNGIGLYVVKSIAKGHGGDAYYKPQEHGSLFGFWISLR